jgi:ribosomal protein L18
MKMMSLYDYLGHAAGAELGEQVAKRATSMGVKMDTREVSNPKYTGKVMLYPEGFLNEYFKNNG